MRWIYRLPLMFFCLSHFILTAQIENRNLFPTPNAAGLGLYGQIPVDQFTGLPSVEIPIYQFKSRDLSIPLRLTYHASNIRPADIPGWVGSGWSLQAGGAITRIMNDLPDELIGYRLSSPVSRGFFYNTGYLSSPDWASYNSLHSIKDVVNIPDNVSINYTRPDLAPDEFQFNFLGMSGSLIMGQDGQWKIKSKQGLNFSVSTVIGPYALWEPTSLYPSSIRNCLCMFVLTGPDGTQYYFGSDPAVVLPNGGGVKCFNSADSTGIEFTRVGVGAGDHTSRDGGTVPTSWYLIKVKSPTGDIISFKYTRDGYQLAVNSSCSGYVYVCPTCSPVGAYDGTGIIDDQVTILDGITLSGIYGANGSVEFNKSKANVLDYTLQYPPYVAIFSITPPGYRYWVTTLHDAYYWEVFATGNNGMDPVSTYMKLDKISIKDNNANTIKSFDFHYYEHTDNRLFLESLTEKGSDGTALPPHSFSYNNKEGLANVPYSTIKVDHWGYYNGVNPFQNLVFYATSDFSLAYNSTFSATYFSNRSPVTPVMGTGILTQITYPTGGNTQFVWEPNDYSKCINQTPVNNIPAIAIQDLGAGSTGAGMRIKQVTSQAGFNAPALSKTYFYYRDYKNNNYLSSGVLNSVIPQYVETYSTANYVYRKWSSNNFLPLSYTNGSPITYTNVAEVNTDGSYTTYTFSNQDNGYLNALPLSSLTTPFVNNNYREINTSSLELERGLLLNESHYGLGSVLLKSSVYQYNNDPNRFSNGIRRIYYSRDFALAGQVLGFDDNGFLTVGAGPIIYSSDNVFSLFTYVHYPYLQSVTETMYDQNGNNPLVNTVSYSYDAYRNKKTEAAISSKGETVNSAYSYAGDAIAGLPTSAAKAQAGMLSAGMTGIQLEKQSTRNGLPTEHVRLDYQSLTNSLSMLVPGSGYRAELANALENTTNYINYDSKGNILEYIQRDGIPVSFDWGYNQVYPTVKVLNATNTFRNYTVATNTLPTGTMLWSAGDFNTKSISFTKTITGTISFNGAFSQSPGNALISYFYNLTGPVSQNGVLCLSGTGSGCSYPSFLNLANMPPGTYTLQITPQSDYSIGNAMYYAYQDIQYTPATTGYKDYFYDGFEENGDPNVVKGLAHTGNACWVSNYTVAFSPVSSQNYMLQYWQLQNNNTWTFHQQPYTAGVTLSGPVDDIRVFPANAQMHSYTYTPLIGMTSEIDPSGKTVSYEYDLFGRLSLVRDQDRNIIKRICYNYAGQQEACPVMIPNTPQTGSFVSNGCAPGYVGSTPVVYTVPAGTWFGATQQAADALAQADVNANGQAYANQHGPCVPGIPNDARAGTFTRNNCTGGRTGGTASYTVPAGRYYALTKAAANQLADADVAANGQGAINGGAGSCLFYNVPINANYYSQNCPSGQLPVPYPVTIPGGVYSDANDQQLADNQAINDAQAQANAHGSCTTTVPTVYARLEIGSSYPENYEYALYVNFYSDAQCTIPANVPDGLRFYISSSGYDEWWINGALQAYTPYTDFIDTQVFIWETSDVLVDDIYLYDGEVISYDGDGNEYRERWKFDYTLNSASGLGVNIIIAAPLVPPHPPGF